MIQMTRLLLGLVLAISTSVLANAQDDKKIEGWGAVVDPDSDCTIEHKEGRLTITVPGTPHNLNERISGLNAPRVLQKLEGDFTVQVKVTGEFKPDPESNVLPRGLAFNGGGLLIWQDAQNFIRLERNVWITGDGLSACYPPLFEHVQDGQGQPTNPPPTLFSDFFNGDSTWFRLERKQDAISASYSHDGKEWTQVKTIPVRLAKSVSVGVAAINTSKKPFQATFSELQVGRGE